MESLQQVAWAVLMAVPLVLLMYGLPAKLAMKLQDRHDDKKGEKWISQLPQEVRGTASEEEAPGVGGPCVRWEENGVVFRVFAREVNSEMSSAERLVVTAEVEEFSPSIRRSLKEPSWPSSAHNVFEENGTIRVHVKRNGSWRGCVWWILKILGKGQA